MTNAFTLGELRGTMAYCPPEIYHGSLFSTSSDVYAIGMVFWELCTRVAKGEYNRPYIEYPDIKFDFQIITVVARDNLRPTIPPEVPDVIANLIEQCWHQDFEVRPSCSTILAILDTVRLKLKEKNIL